MLSDFRFRCRAIPGTQEIRTKISHVGFWARVVYGSGIFCTISPGERHNYLVCKLSRYRADDPYTADLLNKAWFGSEKPKLEPLEEEQFDVHIPGYDARRYMMAEDPLAATNAFFVKIRIVVFTILGIRACPFCPHCAESDRPCQDALGSVAEAMGGIAGRVDAMFGAVECQTTTGALHYHFFIFVQRLHQYTTLKEIAEKLKNELVKISDWKSVYLPFAARGIRTFNSPTKNVKLDNFPTYSETTECKSTLTWGKYKLGRLPQFIYNDAQTTVRHCEPCLTRDSRSALSQDPQIKWDLPNIGDVDTLIDAAK